MQYAGRWLKRKLHSRALILMYHRVTDLPSDPQLLAVSSNNFAEQLAVLQQLCRPISLQDLVRVLQQGRVPNKAVALTFDDGYADNLHQAKPLLARYDIPATVFVATGYVDQQREFWWDELERLLLLPGKLPETVHLRFKSKTYTWDLGMSACYSEQACQNNAGWNVTRPNTPTSRHQLYRDLHKLLRPLPPSAQNQLLDEIRTWAGMDATGRLTHRALRVDEVVHLADGGLIEVGAHTVNHPVLSSLSPAGQHHEIIQSKQTLEEILGDRIKSFSYPFGGPLDFTPATATLVQQGAMTSACSTVAGSVWPNADPFQLPRFTVRNWDGDTFAKQLTGWWRG